MEKLSRTKKYQALRESLQNDAESQVVSKDLTSFQDRLNRLDVMHFDTEEIGADHDPVHARKTNYFEETPVVKEEVVVNEPVVIEEAEIEKTTQYTFNNEYLDEYISEVKQYNKNKGLLKKDDTAMNILEGLKQKEEPVVEPLIAGDPEVDYSNDMDATIPFVFPREKTVSEVSEEVKSLVMDVEDEPVVEEKSAMAKAVEADLEKEQKAEAEKMPEKVEKKPAKAEKKPVLVEEDDDDDSMGAANKILNFVLVLLILALLVVLGVVVYWTLMNRGII